MATFISRSPEQTIALGRQWGGEATAGCVFGLIGELGAGKTQLVKGIASGLGIRAQVHSPTFTLINQYEGGRLPLFHLDLYRLESRDQIVKAGLEDYIRQPDGVTVIEWAERWFQESPPEPSKATGLAPRYRQVRIETIDEISRRITYEDFGA